MRVIFDLDGTLVHSAPDLNAAADRMLAELYGAGPVSPETFVSFIGEGMPVLVERILRHAGLEPAGAAHARALAAFRRFYGASPARLSRVFPGARAALAALAEAGARIGLCTNKPEDLTEKVLRGLGLREAFPVVVGGDTLAVRKPDPAPLRECARRLGGDGPVYYVGDSETDEAAARAAGFPLLLFTGGYSKKPPEEMEAAARFDDFSGLPELVRRLEEAPWR